MATITKSVTETSGTKKSTWTFTITKQDVTTNTNGLQNVALPNISAKYSAVSGKTGCYIDVVASLYIGNSSVGYAKYSTNSNVKLAGNTVKSLSPQNSYFSASNIFNSQNPTVKSVPVLLKSSRIQLESGKYLSSYEFEEPWGDCDLTSLTSWGTLFNIILDAPPTFTASNAASDTNGFFAGISTARVTLSSCSAKYGGTISETKLTIGNKTVTGTGNGTLSIKLAAAGTFTPTVTVTDSRGQTTMKTLAEIIVEPYSLPQVAIQQAERTDASGIPDDEGTAAVVTAAFSYVEAVTDLLRPTICIGGTAQPDSFCSWYASRAADGTLSNPVDWNSYHPSSSVTLYGLMAGSFNKEQSYVIGIMPEDEYNTGLEIRQTLPQAYYTIDVYAGGHGIAFGAPATEERFKVAMPAVFADTAIFQKMAGVIQMFAGSAAPPGWLICQGQAVSRTTYAALFAVIGTTYGSGDGSTTFNLPDFRNNFPVGAGSSYALNAKGGANTVTLTTNQIPAHTHNLPAHEHTSVGGGQAHENRPPYIGINFIICTGIRRSER